MAGEYTGAEHAYIYSSFRKNTPEQIIEKIMFRLKQKYKGSMDLVIDVGCGSGQGTVAIAPYFREVHGIDSSQSQIREAESARKLANVEYRVGSAEVLPFPDGSTQLITASTALHWFDFDKFFSEARRVLCNNGVLAVYGYFSLKPLFKNPMLMKEVDILYDQFYMDKGPYSKAQNEIFNQKYQAVNFPFEEIIRERDIRCPFPGRLSDIIGYITSFSSIQNCRKKNAVKAHEIISKFQKGLYAIGAKENITPDQQITLYRDYFLIICRKVVSSSNNKYLDDICVKSEIEII